MNPIHIFLICGGILGALAVTDKPNKDETKDVKANENKSKGKILDFDLDELAEKVASKVAKANKGKEVVIQDDDEDDVKEGKEKK